MFSIYRQKSFRSWVGVLLLCVVSGAAYADSFWDHNGSLMRLVADGDKRTFTYERPRATLVSAGVRSGTVLFEGVRRGTAYIGTAHRFSKNCSEPLVYSVAGVAESERRVVLTGRREVFDSNCRGTGEFKTDTLFFEYKEEADDANSVLTDFEGTWTTIEGECSTDIHDQSDTPRVMTIDSQITTWGRYDKLSTINEPYDWCDVEKSEILSDRSITVDLGCAHPGHSRAGVPLELLDQSHLTFDGTLFFRCR